MECAYGNLLQQDGCIIHLHEKHLTVCPNNLKMSCIHYILLMVMVNGTHVNQIGRNKLTQLVGELAKKLV